MAEIIRMPKMSDTMTEGVIASWLVKEGDEIASGDIIAEVETDKATMELDNYVDGILLHIGPKEGDAVPVDGIIAIVGEKGEDISSLLSEASTPPAAPPPAKEEPINETAAPEAAIDTSGINAVVVNMPKMSDTMTEGVVSNWLVKVGDKVSSGDILAEVETDKATMELENYEDGTILYLGVDAGGSVPVDGVIAVIGEEGADFEKLIQAEKQKNATPAAPTAAPKAAAPSAPTSVPKEPVKQPTTASHVAKTSSSGGRIKASPLAKKIAEAKGIDISQVPGSGDGGRIIKRDVEHFVPQTAASSTGGAIAMVSGEESVEEIRVSQMRKTIAQRLSDSKFTAPHFYVTMEINMDKAIAARKTLNEVSDVKISFNDLVVKAVASSIRKNPMVNISWQGDKMVRSNHIHIGIAVAVEEGLLVPVVRFADNKSIQSISSEVKDLAQKAATKKLQPADWEGNTFTISNLGMFGVEEFTAIVNPPDACILAVGGIKQTPVVKDGAIVPGNVMKVTLSCDHRAVDGAVGAAFLKTLKETLEDPIRMLL